MAREDPGDASDDTIVALSTPVGRAALATVRLAGPGALAIGSRHVRARSPLVDAPANTVHVGTFHEAGDDEPIDQVVVAVFRAPHSYTGEDVLEISLHGNPALARRAIDALVASGARVAEPGEFTRRAFLNGKLDLSQAEAVARLIDSRTDAAARAALRQLGGTLSTEVGELRRRVLHELAILEATIDFPDEDLADPDRVRMRESLGEVHRALVRLVEAARRGRPLLGVTEVVLTGAPNVGKSSLFNAILGRDRAIVHATPGTTRDVIDAEVTFGAVAARLVDTAGLADAPDVVEAEGVRRTRETLAGGDVHVVVLDGSRPDLTDEERGLVDACVPGRALVVVNKCDRPVVLTLPPTSASPSTPGAPAPSACVLHVSALTGAGVDTLRRAVERTIVGEGIEAGDVLVVGRRQEAALDEAAAAIARARDLFSCAAGHDDVSGGAPGGAPDAAHELVAEELRAAANAIGLITGERVGADVLDVIFSEFCIGK